MTVHWQVIVRGVFPGVSSYLRAVAAALCDCAYTKYRHAAGREVSRDKFFLPCCFHSFCYARSAIPLTVYGSVIWYVAFLYSLF